MSTTSLLVKLEKHRNQHDSVSAEDKLTTLLAISRCRFDNSDEIERFHNVLLFMRAYPNNQKLLDQVEDILGSFAQRSDLKRFREELVSSGIAGCPIDYRFFYPMADWLARNWGQSLQIDWPEIDDADKLMEIIPTMTTYSEASQFDDFEFTAKEWLNRLKNDRESEATFLLNRIARLYRTSFEREALHDKLDLPYRLESSASAPSMTTARYLKKDVSFVTSNIEKRRPDLRKVIQSHPVKIRSVSKREGRQLIDLARTAMITHERDIDAFSQGSTDDVRLVDCGDGLQFACIGTLPERCYLLPAVYGFLNLKNGVPIGYFQVSVIFDMAEISYNTFVTFRGADAAHNYARALAMTHRLFDIRTFVLDNYQLGYGNKEGLLSGVWWFYYKLGFRPRDAKIKKLVRTELQKMKNNSSHRSSLSTLNKLAENYMFLELEPGKTSENVFPLSWNIAPALSRYLADRFSSEREKGLNKCALEASQRLGLRKVPKLSADERFAWNGWAPLVLNLTGIERWSSDNKRKLVKLIKAKAG
ncbi:MAG: hypothetical protein GKR93_09825 [Gammaproteobacteria bacterium]|nr:hypothetical protein [Gammaproteobacteria bacterium]